MNEEQNMKKTKKAFLKIIFFIQKQTKWTDVNKK